MERIIHVTRAGPPPAHGFLSGPAIVLWLAFAKFLFHLLTAGRYGIFRDELYYLACSEHLDFGYVDQPPLIAFITWIARQPSANPSTVCACCPPWRAARRFG